MSDFAAHANATAAGWTRVQIDRGVQTGRKTQFTGVLRFRSEYQKMLTGAPGESGVNATVAAESNVSQAAADTAALAALNGYRQVRYGTGGSSRNNNQGNPHTFDQT